MTGYGALARLINKKLDQAAVANRTVSGGTRAALSLTRGTSIYRYHQDNGKTAKTWLFQADICSWHKASFAALQRRGRYRVESGPSADIANPSRLTQTGHPNQFARCCTDGASAVPRTISLSSNILMPIS